MFRSIESSQGIYQAQLRTLAAIADYSLRRTSALSEAGVEAVREMIAAGLKQCEAVSSPDGRAWPIGLARDGWPGAEVASQWQRKWVDLTARAQAESVELFNQLLADWSAVAPVKVAAPAALEGLLPGALASSSQQLVDSMTQWWTGALGAATGASDAAGEPKAGRKGARGANGSR